MIREAYRPLFCTSYPQGYWCGMAGGFWAKRCYDFASAHFSGALLVSENYV